MSAKDFFCSPPEQVSKTEEKLYAREQLVYNVTEDFLVMLEKLSLSKADLAKRLGKSKSFVTQILSGSRNMTLGTLSDFCFVLGAVPKIKLKIEIDVDKSAAQTPKVAPTLRVHTSQWSRVPEDASPASKEPSYKRVLLDQDQRSSWHTAA